jgi:hypothetical protein
MSHLLSATQDNQSRRASVFDIPVNFKPAPKGSSHVLFLHEPLALEEDFQEEYRRRQKKVRFFRILVMQGRQNHHLNIDEVGGNWVFFIVY